MTPEMEVAVMKQTEDAFRELIQACKNIGLAPATLILMMNGMIEDLKKDIN